MAYQIAAFEVTIPTGTSKAAPAHVATPLGNYVVVGIEIGVPPGFNGAVGFRFTSGGLPVIPSDPTQWIVTSNENISWPIAGQLSSGAWEITGYNTGINSHTLHVRYLLDLPNSVSGAPPAALLDPALIMGQDGTVIAGSLPGASS